MRRWARLGLTLALVSSVTFALWWGGQLGPPPEPTRAGGRFQIVRCPIHGIAYDAELEACPECAKALGTPGGRAWEPGGTRGDGTPAVLGPPRRMRGHAA